VQGEYGMMVKKVALLIVLLLVLVSTSGFAKQDVETHSVHFGLNPFSWLKAGPLLRLFPTQNATGFFLSFRVVYLMLHIVDEWADIDETFHDLAVGTDIGWRYLWEFDNDWGMYLQGYVGLDRFILNAEISQLFIPILPFFGFQIGFHK